MFSKGYFRLILILQLFFVISVLSRGKSSNDKTKAINVLATMFAPYAYFDEVHGIFNGIDILLLKTISERLKLRINLEKVDNIDHVPNHFLE